MLSARCWTRALAGSEKKNIDGRIFVGEYDEQNDEQSSEYDDKPWNLRPRPRLGAAQFEIIKPILQHMFVIQELNS